MALEDWNWRLEADRQDYPWDCAAASTAWCLRAIGREMSEQDVIAGLGPSRISASLGLLDSSGAGLVEYLGELGITAENTANADWDDVVAAAGFQPMVIGGRNWNHWVAVRIGGGAMGDPDFPYLALMNPAPGWMGVDQVLSITQFDELGEFSAVWFTSW